eukprot:3846837-Pleurochrysis_carterae.AAC.1
MESVPLESSDVKRAARRPRVQCRNTECLATRAAMSSELADARARISRLEQHARSASHISNPEVASLRGEVVALKEAAAVMSKSRSTAL